jgi:peptidyl-prolyl cis-trans isomerase SurA
MRKFGLVVLGFVLFTTVASAQRRISLDKIVAVIGNSIVLQSDIEGMNAQALYQGQTPDKCTLVQDQVSTKILVQQAAIDSIEVKEDEIDAEIDRRVRYSVRNAGGQERLEQFLGRSLLQYKEEIRPDVREMLIAQRMRQHITEKLNTTPQDVKDYFRKLPKDSLPTFNKEVEVAEITFDPKLSKEEKDIYKEKAQDLLNRVKKGDDFGALATAYSQDPGTAPQGGDDGFIDRNMYVKEFTGWAFKLKAGELSPVFESADYGYFFLQVLERRGEQVHTRHILIAPPTTPESLERAKGRADTIYNLLDKNRKVDFFASAASFYSDNKDTKYNGGLIMNSEGVDNRTSYIPTDKLDPQVLAAVDTMKVGGITKPVLFTDRQGKKSYRIFYLKSVVDAHKANLEQDFAKIKDFATSDKINRSMADWFAKKRKDTYIRIDQQYQAGCPILKSWASPDQTAPTEASTSPAQ